MKKETLVKIYLESNAKTSILEELITINCLYRLTNRLYHEYLSDFEPSEKMKWIEYHIFLVIIWHLSKTPLPRIWLIPNVSEFL